MDVGDDGEAIVWCTFHTNLCVIYKERSIWRMVGDPDTGYIEQVGVTMGLVNPLGVVAAGAADYVACPQGIYRFNLDQLSEASVPLRPIFQEVHVNYGSLDRPGGILSCQVGWKSCLYDIALGYAMGKLYVGYFEYAYTGEEGSGAGVLLGDGAGHFNAS